VRRLRPQCRKSNLQAWHGTGENTPTKLRFTGTPLVANAAAATAEKNTINARLMATASTLTPLNALRTENYNIVVIYREIVLYVFIILHI